METQKTITVTVPASEPQTTTKEIHYPSAWKVENPTWGAEYLMIFTKTSYLRVTKMNDGNYNTSTSNVVLGAFFQQKNVVECEMTEAKLVFREMQKVHNDLVFGDQQEQFDQAIQSYQEQNFVTDKPIIERKHTEFE